MALADNFTEALKEIEKALAILLFQPYSFEKKGFAYFVQYKRGNCIVKFLYGPPQYEVDMIIYTAKGEFEFKDLLQIPTISSWVNNNKYIAGNGKGVKTEMLWFIELLKISLPVVE